MAGLCRAQIDVEVSALIWQLVLIAGLSAAGWEILRGARIGFRLVAAGVGSFAPVVLSVRSGGYADLLISFLVVASFAVLLRVRREEPSNRAGGFLLALLAAALVLSKNEGW